MVNSSQLAAFVANLTENSNCTDLKEVEVLNTINRNMLKKLSAGIGSFSESTTIYLYLKTYENIALAAEELLQSAAYHVYSLALGPQRACSLPFKSNHGDAIKQYLFSANQFYHSEHDFYQLYLSNSYLSSFPDRPEDKEPWMEGSEAKNMAVKYIENVLEFVRLLKMYQKTLIGQIRKEISQSHRSSLIYRAWNIGIILCTLLVALLMLSLLSDATHTVQEYTITIWRRTAQLRAEKRKSDSLLSQMLPTTVIRQLKMQRQVVAENFDNVTVFFCDIVGFTEISATSSPMEVVMMLNSLYGLFDSRIRKYDVYKVETIGDSYMVVSGLPQKNGNQHASEIATMALDLMLSLESYRIPHRPSESLQVRVGLNTGPCVAGVVGTTMPRYCLFGDTINTASRMESTGEAMKIHITNDTKEYLDKIGGFFMEPRGKVEIKGKGLMDTFWLTGKEGGVSYVPDIGFNNADFVPEFIQMIGTSTVDDDILETSV